MKHPPNTGANAGYAGQFSLRVSGWRQLLAAWLSSWTLPYWPGRAQNGFHRSQQMRDGIRLDQHNHGLEPGISGVKVYRWQCCGGHDDRQGHSGGTCLLEQRQVRKFLQAVVSNKESVAFGGMAGGMKCLPARFAVFGGVHLVAEVLQHLGIKPTDVRLMPHHENAARRIRLASQQCAGLLPGLRADFDCHSYQLRAGKHGGRYTVFYPYTERLAQEAGQAG